MCSVACEDLVNYVDHKILHSSSVLSSSCYKWCVALSVTMESSQQKHLSGFVCQLDLSSIISLTCLFVCLFTLYVIVSPLLVCHCVFVINIAVSTTQHRVSTPKHHTLHSENTHIQVSSCISTVRAVVCLRCVPRVSQSFSISILQRLCLLDALISISLNWKHTRLAAEVFGLNVQSSSYFARLI